MRRLYQNIDYIGHVWISSLCLAYISSTYHDNGLSLSLHKLFLTAKDK